jgi:tetratricopeptide (TPR) repeat protein
MTLAKPFRDSNPEVEAQYKALLRSLRRTKGFGIVFVQCTPDEATRLITSVKEDLPQKNIGVLNLPEPIDNLYQLVEAQPDRETLNILFIQGIEKSLEPYIKPGYGGEGDYYKLDTVPRILSHLNQQRENFRDHFSNLCFVFIVPRFALKYFIQRAPDFFDWQSRVSVFPIEPDLLEQASSRILSDGDYNEYLELPPPQRNQKLLEIQELLQEKHQSDERKSRLFFRQGNLFAAAQNYEAAIASYEQALAIKPDKHEAFNNRGLALSALGRYEEALKSYEQALAIKPDKHEAFNNRGLALSALGRYEEALKSYEQALAIKPNYYQAFNNQGVVLSDLGRNEEALKSYEQALAIKSEHEALNNRGNALSALGRYEEALKSYEQVLVIKSDDHEIWYNKACCYALWTCREEAIESLQKAIDLHPEYREMAKTDSDFDKIRDDERFQALVNGG